jgi:hypothetical protein
MPRPAMYFGMRVSIAFDTERRQDSFGDRSLRNSAPGNADLEDGTGQKKK